MTFRRITVLLGWLAAMFAAPAFADIKWQFKFSDQGCTISSCPGGIPNYKTASYVSDSNIPKTDVKATAWADTVNKNDGTSGNPTSGKIESAYLATWSGGLGVQNKDGQNVATTPSGGGSQDGVEGSNPEHAMDSNERYEAILFSFKEKTTLTGVEIGWSQTDSDIFVLAYTGSGTPPTNGLDGLYFSQLTTNGWTLVGNYADLPVSTTTTPKVVSVNDGTNGVAVQSSNYWLIGTYNPDIKAPAGVTMPGCTVVAGGGDGKCDKRDDYVKLLALYSKEKTNGVPEPGALLLFGIALAGIWGTRRKLAA